MQAFSKLQPTGLKRGACCSTFPVPKSKARIVAATIKHELDEADRSDVEQPPTDIKHELDDADRTDDEQPTFDIKQMLDDDADRSDVEQPHDIKLELDDAGTAGTSYILSNPI